MSAHKREWLHFIVSVTTLWFLLLKSYVNSMQFIHDKLVRRSKKTHLQRDPTAELIQNQLEPWGGGGHLHRLLPMRWCEKHPKGPKHRELMICIFKKECNNQNNSLRRNTAVVFKTAALISLQTRCDYMLYQSSLRSCVVMTLTSYGLKKRGSPYVR